MAQTANQKIYEAAVRHQVHLLRFAEGEAERLVALLRETEQELLDKIAGAFAAGKDASRLESVLKSVQERREQVYQAMAEQLTSGMEQLAEAEAEWEEDAIKSAVPVRLNTASVPLEQLRAVVQAPISGLPLEGWLSNVSAAEATALQRAVSMAVVEGQTIDQLVGRIRGTKAGNYEDGILSTSRRNAQALARTAVSHVANGAREQVWEQNSDIVRAKRWVSTLDGRTSSICQANDGAMVPVGDSKLEPGERALASGVRPPAHFNCRSVLVAVLDGVELAGDRPFVADSRTRAERERAFRAEAKERGVDVKQVRQEWADRNVGRLPAKTTYDEWLRKQPKEFQDEVLGPARAELFRGGMPVDRFVDASGKRLTIEQLKAEFKGDALAVAQPGVGMKAKALLMKGATDEQALAAIKAEFPDASTGMNSIKSYKSELKKAGLLDASRQTSTTPYQSMKLAVEGLEQDLTPGLKHAVGGQWAQVVDSLDGAPGAYAHYQAGQGVKVSSQALAALPAEQTNQVLAHELGHLLHKQHGLYLPSASFDAMKAAAKALPADQQKLYSYYLSHSDELVAEVYAQALSPSAITSQGISATGFKQAFGAQIDAAKEAMAKKFPAPTTPAKLEGAPHLLGEVAGQHKTVGSLAKALIQQGLSDDQVLAGVKAQFPDAKTGINSIKSYKSELKKAGLAPTKGTGPVVQSAPEFKPVPTGQAAQPAWKVKAKELLDSGESGGFTDLNAMLESAGFEAPLKELKEFVSDYWAPTPPTPVPIQQVVSGPSKTLPGLQAAKAEVLPSEWQKVADQLFAKGVPMGQSVDELQALFPHNPKLLYPNVASYKTAWKKKVGSAASSQADKLGVAAAKVGQPAMASKTADAVQKATTGFKPPKLYGQSLGPLSSKVYPNLVTLAKKGGSFEESIAYFKVQYGANFDPSKGVDLWKLAEWEAKGKPGLAEFEAQKAAAEAVAKAAAAEKAKLERERLNALFKPSRPATTPREGLPPPPRYTRDAWRAAVERFNGGSLDTGKINNTNATQKRLGLEELTQEEYSAIRSYTGNAWYRRVNKALREGQYAEDNAMQALVEAAQHGMAKMPKYVGRTNRGMSLHGADLERALSTYRVGAIVEENGFVSTSTASGFGGNVRVVVNGKSGVDVAPISHYGSEAEVLFMPGTRFRVDSVTKAAGSYGGDVYTVEMTEV